MISDWRTMLFRIFPEISAVEPADRGASSCGKEEKVETAFSSLMRTIA